MTDDRLFVTVVLDGVGIGAQADSALYGDEESDTLGHVCRVASPRLPNLGRLGLGCIRGLDGVPAASHPAASYGRMRERSAGKDSTTGHWELAGLQLDNPLPTYPNGFPDEVLKAFLEVTNVSGLLANRPASGTEVIVTEGLAHLNTGHPIVYTSGDSVLQIAAHVDVVPLATLYDWCSAVRHQVCTGRHAVGRVIARPFEGSPGAFRRISAARKDFALSPPGATLPGALQQAGVRTVSIGKVAELFAGEGFDESIKTRSNAEGVARLLERVSPPGQGPTFIWVNLVDFDQEYGHRNDAGGFARALEEFDRSLPRLLEALPSGARLAITADHGNDPTTPGTDHSREYVPLLYVDGLPSRDLGTRSTFADHAATAAVTFGVDFESGGEPF